jgi:hypothetical protein
VLAADTLSILTMEIVDNAVMALLPGAMNAGLMNVVFWLGMMISPAAAFTAAFPVNRYLEQRGKGHALTHPYHGAPATVSGWHRTIPTFSTGALTAAIVAFMLGGLVVSSPTNYDQQTPPSQTHPNHSLDSRRDPIWILALRERDGTADART